MTKTRVLIVDDEPKLVRLVHEILTATDYQVLAACNGDNAVEMIAVEKPDLILLDLKLPGDMDGYQVLTQLKRSMDTASIPVIVITGSLTDEEVKQQKVLALGADRFLTKPFEIDDLITEIRQFMGEGQVIR